MYYWISTSVAIPYLFDSITCLLVISCRLYTYVLGLSCFATLVALHFDILGQDTWLHQQKKGSLRARQWLRPDASVAPWASFSPLPPIHGLSILVAPRCLRSNTTWMEYTCSIRRVNSAPGTPEDTLGISLSEVSIGRQTSTLQISSAVLLILLYSVEVFRE